MWEKFFLEREENKSCKIYKNFIYFYTRYAIRIPGFEFEIYKKYLPILEIYKTKNMPQVILSHIKVDKEKKILTS